MIVTFLFGKPDTNNFTLDKYEIPDEVVAMHRCICLVRDGEERWFTEDALFDESGEVIWFEHWNPPISLDVEQPLSSESFPSDNVFDEDGNPVHHD